MDGRNNLQPGCSPDDTRGKNSKHRQETNEGSWEGQNQPSLPGLRIGEVPGSRGDLRRDERVPNATRFPSANNDARPALGQERRLALQSVRGGRPSPALPGPTHLRTPCRRYRPEMPATQLSLPVRSSRPSPSHFRGRSRPPGGFGLDGV